MADRKRLNAWLDNHLNLAEYIFSDLYFLVNQPDMNKSMLYGYIMALGACNVIDNDDLRECVEALNHKD